MAATTASSGWKRTSPSASPQTKAHRQAAAQFPPRGLFSDPAVEARAQDVEFGFTHRAFEPQQGAVVEHGRMIDPVGVADQRVGKSRQIDEAIPFGLIAGDQ